MAVPSFIESQKPGLPTIKYSVAVLKRFTENITRRNEPCIIQKCAQYCLCFVNLNNSSRSLLFESHLLWIRDACIALLWLSELLIRIGWAFQLLRNDILLNVEALNYYENRQSSFKNCMILFSSARTKQKEKERLSNSNFFNNYQFSCPDHYNRYPTWIAVLQQFYTHTNKFEEGYGTECIHTQLGLMAEAISGRKLKY